MDKSSRFEGNTASVPGSVSERLPDPVPQQELVESFPIDVFWGKMLTQLHWKILCECAYSVKTLVKAKLSNMLEVNPTPL